MLPLRPIIESVGYSVSWSRNTNTVIISSGKPLATRLAFVKLEGTSGGYYFEIMSDGRIDFLFALGYSYLSTDDFDMPKYIPADLEYYTNKQGLHIRKTHSLTLPSSEFEVLKKMIDALGKYDGDDRDDYSWSGGRSVHVVIDGKLYLTMYGPSYDIGDGIGVLWDKVILHDIAYFIIDKFPLEENKYLSTPKDLTESGDLKDYSGLSNFYYRYGEEP